MSVKLIFFSGSCRKNSFNKKLAKNAALLAAAQGATATEIDLAEYDMPIYNGDFEESNGLPENAIKLKRVFVENDGFFIASPEYNGSISPLLKNTLDWISRPHTDKEPPLSAYKGKVSAIASASPGGLGGLRGLVPLRMLLSNINVTVIPEQIAIPQVHEAFDKNDLLIDNTKLESLVTSLVATTAALKG